MTLPFAFVFIGAFILLAVFLIWRKSITRKKEVTNTASRQDTPQGPVDTSARDKKAKEPLKQVHKTGSPRRKAQ